jgi:hypothetical protein
VSRWQPATATPVPSTTISNRSATMRALTQDPLEILALGVADLLARSRRLDEGLQALSGNRDQARCRATVRQIGGRCGGYGT